ncbi:DUF2182 domain-containing protein [Defluviimonas aestuarii]|uniref:DUF2182 domain-containing protein n=1 Tax=Albidovulum aestuarii TaxID=1130726 RepID=UPI00249AA1D5|nr:DUF2182 domain-containing protein [Defluviimonas aestuarii]MDI3335197.1 DUF2182 domain-containing protein [Defluviimonas aestuarii]
MSAPILRGERRGPVWLSPRAVGWLGFYGLILLSWIAVALMARGLPGAELADVPAEFWAALCASAADANPIALWAMWALMATAMMLPTFVPALRTFNDLSATGATTGIGAAALVAGYVAVWLVASVLGASTQWALARQGMLTPAGASLSPWLTAALLFGAGAYQFSAFKASCLAKCRMPLTFFMQHWQPGPAAALTMGLRLGALCLGCCWALMALGFVGGAMNLIWMGAATLFMTLEKLPEIGRWLSRPAGWALILAGGIVTLRALQLV